MDQFEIDHRAYEAINEGSAALANLVLSHLRAASKFDPSTILAGIGFVLGDTLLRVSGQDLDEYEPGTPVENPWIDANGQRLSILMAGWLTAQGLKVLPPGFPSNDQARGGIEGINPAYEPAQLANELRPSINRLMESRDLGFEDRVLTASLAAVRLLIGLREAIGPEEGASIIMRAVAIAGRHAPMKKADEQVPPALSMMSVANG
ncbi:MAG: hypothetical protein KI792_02185 [Alphaproteobacteria bacterium]|nr:hypothetical protein [Alphaproteobacteria bacterium SS10]